MTSGEKPSIKDRIIAVGGRKGGKPWLRPGGKR